ncbi:MAG: ribosome silencing factor [bacterium]
MRANWRRESLTDTAKLQEIIIQSLKEKKAQNITLIDMKEEVDWVEMFVICTGMVDLHRKVLAEHLLEKTRKAGYEPLSVGGLEYVTFWILMDFGSIVLHIFSPEARKYYNLEGIWGRADGRNIINIEEE